jgi:hypothetical protein
MENAQTILVIFLSVALAVFLILGIILLSICIKIARHVKNISEKAEQITDKAENLADFFSKAATPMAVGRIISQVGEIVFNRKGKKKRE